MKSAGRVLDLVEILVASEQGLTFTDLLRRTGFPKSSLHALLDVLTQRSYAHFDQRTNRYSLGIQVWQNGQAYLRSRSIVREAGDAMGGIGRELNETVQLACLDGTENVYLAKVDSTHPLRLQSEVGARLAAHATGLGKALLSGLPDDEIRRRHAGRPLVRMTPNTITSLDALLAEAARIRATGFSVDDEEYTPGLVCVAVPVRDSTGAVVVALSVAVPIIRASTDVLGRALTLLARASVDVTRRLHGPTDAATVRLADGQANAGELESRFGFLRRTADTPDAIGRRR
ncbi:IclR family transcriptional regulator [Prosthecomicrobium sp. N25]|uniref:IclR family transcriptional regulator n=1 Tax=Prosthecomicrobium sp. N25 TaxID=3129254 RepID=UPI0030771619